MMKPILPSTGRTHAANSHPEPEERSRKPVTKSWPVNAEMQARLEDHMRDNPDETNVSMGRRLGYPDGSVVSKYRLAGREKTRAGLTGINEYDRDPRDIETRLAEFFQMESRMKLLDSATILDTSVVRQCAKFYDDVRDTGGVVGVLHCAAGLGKTTAAVAYVGANPTTTLLTANARQNDARGVTQLFWEQAATRGMSKNAPRWNHLVTIYRGSGRLIIMDNAQRLDRSGRDFLFDFMDATGCPLVLQGNPEIKTRVASNDQQYTRTLMEYSPRLKDLETVVRDYLSLRTDRAGEIMDLALRVVRQKDGGHLRALRNLTMSAQVLMRDARSGGDYRKAFEKALALSIAHKG
jgi:DNA transposition AAA+ family ATPase